jgi:hypothetical protein
VLLELYTVLLQLYPRQFRRDFAAEMKTVFGEALGSARREGLWAILRLCGREVRELPHALAREHMQSIREDGAGMAKSRTRLTHIMMTNRRPRWFFYPAWVALSAISIPIAGGIALALVSIAKKVVGNTIQVGGYTHITEDYLSGDTIWLVFGLLSGFLQYLLLRRYLPRMGWWIAATMSGLLLGLVGNHLLFQPLYSILDSMWFGILMTVLVGGSMGLVQWVVLRQRVHHAAWWILANVLGWGVIGWGAEILTNQIIPVVGILVVPGIATSVALWLLLDQLSRSDGSGKNPTLNKSLELTH